MLNGFVQSDKPTSERLKSRGPVVRSRRVFVPLALGLLLLIAAALLIAGYAIRSESNPAGVATSRVQRHSFALQVHERGIVRPARVVPIKSEISSNRAKVVWLHDEGERVTRGQIVARFDTKPFIDAMEKAEQNLADAKARLIGAEKALQLQQEDNAAKLEAARRKLEIARIKAEDLRSGTGQLQRRKLLLNIAQAKRAYQISQNELTDFDELLAQGHVSQRERDIVADKFRKASETVELNHAELENFDRYEMPRLLREAELLTDAAENEQLRVRRTSALELERRKAEVIKQQRDIRVAEARLDKAREELESSDVRAPIDGTLLYLMVQGSQRGQKEKVQLGDAIWFGQTFMEIPDTHDLVVDTYIREIDVAKLTPAMEAIIELDAFPNRLFSGQLVSIGWLAESDAERAHLRHYQARVRFHQPPPEAHVGMSADVKIAYRTLDEVIAVSTAAVEYQNGTPTVRLRKSGKTEQVPVTLGEIGPEWAEVISGLVEGDEVEVNSM